MVREDILVLFLISAEKHSSWYWRGSWRQKQNYAHRLLISPSCHRNYSQAPADYRLKLLNPKVTRTEESDLFFSPLNSSFILHYSFLVEKWHIWLPSLCWIHEVHALGSCTNAREMVMSMCACSAASNYQGVTLYRQTYILFTRPQSKCVLTFGWIIANFLFPSVWLLYFSICSELSGVRKKHNQWPSITYNQTCLTKDNILINIIKA